MTAAIYARQSVDKKDSISIETQIEDCKRSLSAAEAENARVYSDKGYSGKNTDRPRFQEMMDDIKDGKISKIIVYKLDRISRSLLDFVTMEQDFIKHSVAFVSVNEKFDTSSESGEFMMRLLMMFAEMERKQIQKRIKDNYYARGERSLYLGGYAPFGYEKISTKVDGKKTCMFQINAAEAQIYKSMAANFLAGKSLNAIASSLNRDGVPTRKGAQWSGGSVSRMLKNPVYVKANADVYSYLESLGAAINSDIGAFTGENGLLVYGNADERKSTKTSKFTDFSADKATVGLHKGIISADVWLSVQLKLSGNRGHTNIGSGKSSWLQGLVKCGACGFSLYVKKCRGYRYFYCRGKKQGSCTADKKMLQAGIIEAEIEELIFEQLKQYRDTYVDDEEKGVKEENDCKIQIGTFSQRIEKLMDALEKSDEFTAAAIKERIGKLAEEKDKLTRQLLQRQTEKIYTAKRFSTLSIADSWEKLGIEERKIVAKSIIKAIFLNGGNIEVELY